MVEDRITDGKRIAQLLASELSGRETAPLAAVAVSDADPDATPSSDGTEAFAVRVAGERVARLFIYPDYAAMRVELAHRDEVRDSARDAGLSVSGDDEALVVKIESGAAVKRAVDALVAGLVAAE